MAVELHSMKPNGENINKGFEEEADGEVRMLHARVLTTAIQRAPGKMVSYRVYLYRYL